MSRTPIPAHHDGTGTLRKLGRRRPNPRKVRAVPTWTQAGFPLVPRDQWEAFEDDPSWFQIKDQGQFGACNGHSDAECTETARHYAGMPHVPLSGFFDYALLCNGIDEGSGILDSIAMMTGYGVAPEALVPAGTIDPRNFTPDMMRAAKRFRCEVAASITTWDEFVSAVLLRMPVNASLRVGNNFNALDPDGVPGYERGAGNHSMSFWGGLKLTKQWGWVVRAANHWTPQWGWQGFAWMGEAHTLKSGFSEAFALRAVTDDPLDQTNPPTPA